MPQPRSSPGPDTSAPSSQGRHSPPPDSFDARGLQRRRCFRKRAAAVVAQWRFRQLWQFVQHHESIGRRAEQMRRPHRDAKARQYRRPDGCQAWAGQYDAPGDAGIIECRQRRAPERARFVEQYESSRWPHSSTPTSARIAVVAEVAVAAPSAAAVVATPAAVVAAAAVIEATARMISSAVAFNRGHEWLERQSETTIKSLYSSASSAQMKLKV